jgi:nicotinamidase/pyrazinamidase
MASYDPHTALIVVDLQNDFADPQGALYVRGGELVIPAANAEIARARAAGALVVYTQDWHPPSTPHFQKDGGIWPVHCVQGSWGAELHPALVRAGDVVSTGLGKKDGYSAFEERDAETGAPAATSLESLLRSRGIERLVVLGLATDYCVRATVLDGLQRGFPTTVLTAAVRPVELVPGDGERALDEMRRAGARFE